MPAFRTRCGRRSNGRRDDLARSVDVAGAEGLDCRVVVAGAVGLDAVDVILHEDARAAGGAELGGADLHNRFGTGEGGLGHWMSPLVWFVWNRTAVVCPQGTCWRLCAVAHLGR